jgi:hypothetical protein
MTRVCRGLIAAVFICFVACEEERTSCVADDECFGAPELQTNERCAPKDIWCNHGLCSSNGCVPLCEVTQADVNPCRDPDTICTQNESQTSTAPAMCTDHPIRCTSVKDCPLYRPSANPDAQWECEDSFCRFPGYEYRSP